jgi:tripartite-type tricarboxylate transporter receptor subunit TctC
MKSVFLAIILLSISFFAVSAEPWKPSKPIEIIVPYAPGGSTDTWGRVVGKILADHGWANAVVNKPGADTTIASNLVATSKPDGHTLYLSGIGFLDANLAFKNRPEGIKYTEKSFTDIVPLGSGTLVFAVANKVPVSNYDEFKAYIRKNPNQFNVGFFNQYIANLFYSWAQKEGLPRPNIIMYKGSGPMGADLLGGHINFAWDTYNTIAQHQQAGKVKVFAVLDAVGYDLVKKANPGQEFFNVAAKYPELSMPIYYGVSGPADMPKEAVAEINRVINKGLADPFYTKGITDLFITVKGGTPSDLKRSHTALFKLFKKVAQETGN